MLALSLQDKMLTLTFVMFQDRAVAFWSYVHIDDEAVAGRIIRLSKLVREEFALTWMHV